MQDRDDPISVCRLYEKISKTTGNTYFAGRWGNAKVLLFKSKEVAEDGSAIWDLKLAQAQPRPQHRDGTMLRTQGLFVEGAQRAACKMHAPQI